MYPILPRPVSSSILSTMQVDPAGQYKLAAVVIFFVFQIVGGHLGVPVILLTLIFRKGMKRHPMLINFLVTWVIYSTSFCILWVEFLQIISAILITVFLGCISESSLALSLQMLYAYFRRPRYMEQRSCERYFGLCSIKRVNIVLVHRTPTAGLSFVLNVSPMNPYCSHHQF